MKGRDFPKDRGRWLWAVLVAVGLTACFISLTSKREARADTRKALIEASNPCHRLKKVEENTVFLESTGEACVQVIGKIPVEIDSSIKTVRIHVDGRFWKEQALIELDMEEINNVTKRAEEMAKSLKISENRHREEMQAAAEKLARNFHSQASRQKIQAETERLKGGLFAKQLDQAKTEETGVKATPPESGYLRPTERIYLFVSSSMPMAALRNYAADLGGLADPNIRMLMRGMVGGMKYVRPTTEFVSRVTVADTECKIFQEQCGAHNVNFMIDPLLFRRFGIAQVPAVVYVSDLRVIDAALSEGLVGNAKAAESHVVYGDAPIAFLLKQIQKKADSGSLQRIVTALQDRKRENE